MPMFTFVAQCDHNPLCYIQMDIPHASLKNVANAQHANDICRLKTIGASTHTHNRFTALWILSGTTRVSRY